MTKKLTLFEDLRNATTAAEIVTAAAAAVWHKDGNTSDPPPIAPDDLKPHETVQIAHDRKGGVDIEAILDTPIPLVRQMFGLGRGQIYPTPELNAALYETFDQIENLGDLTVGELKQAHPDLWEKTNVLNGVRMFFTIGVFLIEDFAERIEAIHHHWKEVHAVGVNMPHPLASIVRAWLIEQTAKHITAKYDSKHPAAILKHPMGNIRDVILTPEIPEDIGEISSISAPPPTSDQIEIPGFADKSPLPDVLPLQAIRMDWGGDTTKRGAVAMPIRLFFEALMALEPKETQASIKVKLGELLNHLNPDAKYHRTTHLPYVIQGLHNLGWLRIPYRENPDKPSTEVDWIPILPRTVPNINSGDDAPIILEVKLPPDATGGMMVEKDILRLTGKHSSAKFNAYLSACWLIDRNGTVPQGIIDPTKPVERRDDEGNLLTAEGTRIFDRRGKPITSLYKAASQLDREPNPARERYPVLSFDDLTRACFPKGYNQKKKATYRQRALKAWEELETNGIIRIEKKRHGWRIMPSVAHVARYRAIDGTRG